MSKILLTAFSYLLMIAFGYLFKRIGLVGKESGKAMSQIVMKVTLPAAVIASFATFKLDYSMLILILFGFMGNVLQLLFGIVYTKGKDRNTKIGFIANCGYNIGNFTLPFTSSFAGALGTVTTSLFDSGNALMLLGFNFLAAQRAADSEKKKLDVKRVIKSLLSSPAFDAYIVMLLIVLPGGSVPRPIITVASEIAKANGGIAMFMIGILLEIHFNKRYLKSTAVILGARALISIVFSIIISQLSFLPYEVIKAGIIVSWSPIATLGPAYVAILDGDTELASFMNTMSILISMVVITSLAILL